MDSKNLDPRTVNPRQLSWLRVISFHHLLVILFGLTLALPLTSCGGGGEEDEEEEDEVASKKRKRSSSKKKKGGSSKKKRSKGNSARQDAIDFYGELKDDGARKDFPDEMKKAYRYIKNGDKYRDDDEPKKAESSYKRAMSVLKSIEESAGEAEGIIADAKKARKAAETARKEADKIEAAVNAPDSYKDAVEKYEKALELAEDGDTDSLEEAIQEFEDAAAYFGDATEESKEGAKQRLLADRSKVLMGTYKEKAKANKADIKALTQWQQGEQSELMAQTSYETGDFQLAAQQFNNASSIYTAALRSVLNDAAFETQMAAAKKEEEERRKQFEKDQAERIARLQGAGGGNIPPPPPPSGGGDSTSSPGGGTFVPNPGIVDPGLLSGPTALCVKDVAAQFPQELDEEDEAFLIENINHLSGVARYDPETGGIEMNYTSGRKLQKDLNVGNTPKKFLQFRDPAMPPVAGDIPESAQTSMAGNTRGFAYIPVPMIYKVNMTWEFSVQTMTGTGQFGAFVSFDPKRKSRIRTNFLDIGIAQGGRAPKWKKKSGKTGSQANYWHTKLRPVNWIIDFQAEEPGKGKKSALTATYDFGGEEEDQSRVSGKLTQGGFVGFEWVETKFLIKKLKICGFLDKKAAVEMLRKKLGVKKGTKVEPEGDDDDGDGDDDDDVTVPKGDPADKPKVDDDDFDF